jgi:hypothetical protein
LVPSSIVIASLERSGVERKTKQSRSNTNNHGILSPRTFLEKNAGLQDDRRSRTFSEKKVELQDNRREIAALSAGRPGVLINFLENPEELTKYQEKAEGFIKIIENDLSEKWQIIDQIMPRGAKFLESQEIFQSLLLIWKSVIRDLLLIKNNLLDSLTNLLVKEELKKLAQKYSSLELKTILEEIDLARKYLGQNVNPRLVIENLMLKL